MAASLMVEGKVPPERPPALRLISLQSGSDSTDEQLVYAFVRGDDRAFGTLVQRYQSLVYALVRRYASRPEDARDLAQKAFLKAFAASRRVGPRLKAEPLQFKAWLLRIAVNVGKNHSRDSRRWHWVPEEALEVVPNQSKSAPELMEEHERGAQMRAAVLSLPKRQREVLTLRVDGGLAFAEVATILGITENNAKVHFHHAVKRLKGELAPEQAP